MEVDNMNPCDNCPHASSRSACGRETCEKWRQYFIYEWDMTCLKILRALYTKGKGNDTDKSV